MSGASSSVRCDCIAVINAALAKKNTRLALSISRAWAFPTVMTAQIEKGRGKPPALVALPSYCPFCGIAYAPPKDVDGPDKPCHDGRGDRGQGDRGRADRGRGHCKASDHLSSPAVCGAAVEEAGTGGDQGGDPARLPRAGVPAVLPVGAVESATGGPAGEGEICSSRSLSGVARTGFDTPDGQYDIKALTVIDAEIIEAQGRDAAQRGWRYANPHDPVESPVAYSEWHFGYVQQLYGLRAFGLFLNGAGLQNIARFPGTGDAHG